MWKHYNPTEYWLASGKRFEEKWTELPLSPERVLQQEMLLEFLNSLQFTSVLEFGCGYGRITKLLLERYPSTITEYVAIDISPDKVKATQSLVNSEKIEFQVCDVLEFQSAKKYDLVLMCELLMHVRPGRDIETAMQRVMAIAAKHIVNVDWYESEEALSKYQKKIGPHNFVHDYPKLYKWYSGSVNAKIIPIKNKEIDSKQSIFYVSLL